MTTDGKKFQNTKRVIGIRQSKKNRQHNGKKKKIKLRPTKHYIKIQHRATHDYRISKVAANKQATEPRVCSG
jgi:hypothetical protein